MSAPDTRPSILLRLRDHSDRDAWQQFENVYRGVVARVAIRYGMQSADAADLAQDVLIRVSQNIHRFEHDRADAKFRTWLGTLIRSAIVDCFRTKPRDVASGLPEVQAQLELLPDQESDQWHRVIDTEARHEIFRWAAERIRNEYAASSWDAFWKTSVENQSVQQVAEELGSSVGAIYTSRSRIMKRLRDEVQKFDESAAPSRASQPVAKSVGRSS